jgi:hypothetical protein
LSLHRARALAALVAAGGLACASPDPSAAGLARRYPEVGALSGQRLGDIHPFVLPSRGHLTFFLCRWNTGTPLAVSLPADATDAEREALEDALRAWEGAGLGLRFVPVTGGEAPIQIELVDGPVQTPAGPDTGNAVVDCRLGPLPASGVSGDRLPGAELVSARLRLARKVPDSLGREQPLSPDALRGIALHELGHALGFQGHARRGPTVMVREIDVIRRAGRRLSGGERFDDATLRALYAVPNGAVLVSAPVAGWRTEDVDRMARLAAEKGLDGPFARVGETAARVYWRDDEGREYGLWVVNLLDALRDPAAVLVVAEPRVRRALPRGADRRPG